MGSGFCCDQYLPKHWMSRPMTAWFGVMIALRWLIQGFCTSAGLLAAGDSSLGGKCDLHFAGSCLSWLLCGSCNRLQPAAADELEACAIEGALAKNQLGC